eukprot:CAMPEP_0179286504 /NCGR_PEP_ID=MMETSP0797-20121207/39778_1 /TAXON_ID=47934 /ORGANISM="Dinophysis acuminata, Strain DAEP01" /LENGTH=769 /DNA_ID=CAMNT_0020995395 /DNA_START=1 /DNA_END=2311 /DNA_ORIENTATION=-
MSRNRGGGGGGTPRYKTVAEAAQAQNEDAALEMLGDGFAADSADADGNTALHWAAWFRSDALLARLLGHGARADARNHAGETPVHWAAKSSNIQSVQAMTEGDHSMLSQRDTDGFTPFIILAQNDNAPVMEWMYLRGISVEEQDNWGRTALHWACYKGHRRTVQFLLSRSANIAHRDHEGMTAIHWAALKGHELIADMLINVGAVHLLHMPDVAGDTPIDLAMRKKNRYLVINFHKCQLFGLIFGRPHLAQSHFAGLFLSFTAFNVLVFLCILLPGIAGQNPGTAAVWLLLMGVSLCLWYVACRADPGWLAEQTVLAQDRGPDGSDRLSAHTFDAEQPIESQMLHTDDASCLGPDGIERLELEQNKYNFQRQLLVAARRRLEDGGRSDGAGGATARGAAELQPLMDTALPSHDLALASQQLDSASFELRQRTRKTGESLGRERVSRLVAHGRGEYLELLDKGCFKQVCVVCRSCKELRSHHCKDCGRCVRRLDHHCPWIDNCVGLGNQRAFYCFIVALLAAIITFYRVVFCYVADAIVPAWTSGEAVRTLFTVSEWSVGPELRPLLVLLACAFNSVWLAFVGALVARSTAYMAANVTTFEVLTRPAHVQRRFPRNQGRCWFMQGCDFERGLRHCLGYWTLDMSQDALVFAPAEGGGGPGAPGEDPLQSGRGTRRGAGAGSKGGIAMAPDAVSGGTGAAGDTGGQAFDNCNPDRLEAFMACEKKDVDSGGGPPAMPQSSTGLSEASGRVTHEHAQGRGKTVPGAWHRPLP